MAKVAPVPRFVIMVVASLGLLLGGYAYIQKAFPSGGDNRIFSVSYEKPVGWKEEVPGPYMLFVFRHPSREGSLRAAINEVQSRHNPTPELDTDGIADHFIDVTQMNMKDWTAKRLPDIAAGKDRFSVIRRQHFKRTVYTAFCSKGNTTVVVSLTWFSDRPEAVEEHVPAFKKLVGSFRLKPKELPPLED